MLIRSPSFAALAGTGSDICIIGAGPLGLITAMALEDRGFSVLLLESGGTSAEPAAQALSEAEITDPDSHHDPAITVARRLGGTSNLWGGRCVPLDAIDFAPRPWLGLGAWPIGPAALAPYLAPACAAFGAGGAVFSDPPPGLEITDPAFSTDTLERWSDQPRSHLLHRARLKTSRRLRIALHTTVLGFAYDPDGRIAALDIHIEGEGRGRLPVKRVILAGGGNESLRLLLSEQAKRPALFGGEGGPLGRFYMGHVNGQIADIVFASDALHAAMDFYVDGHGSYVRRRIVPSVATQEAEKLANISFWPVVPEISAPAHRSGPLSAVFLALSLPGLGRRLIAEPIRLKHLGAPPYRRARHVGNVLGDLSSTLSFVPWFLWHRYFARHRVPGFFLKNRARRYGLEFHSEQLPDAGSRITLADRADRLGLRRLHIDFRFSDADAASVLRAHDALERWLRAGDLGRLIYRVPRDRRAGAVFTEAKHGNHQIGTIRMARNAKDGIVDENCRSFDIANLHVISTAVLPTSSQANPTLAAAQLGLRLAGHMAGAGGL